MRLFAQALVLAVATLPSAARADADTPARDAETGVTECIVGICSVRLTPQQLLARAEALVRERRFDEAEPMIDALAQAPETRFQSRFLSGYSASEQGKFALAANIFKSILADDPKQTRVRLELARAMLAMGQMQSADRQFRIAEQQGDLPPDIARAIRGARSVIRSQRAWRLDVDFGIAPDSNINNATGNDSVTVYFGDTALPVELDRNAQARSGTGLTASVSTGLRVPLSPKVAALADLDLNGTNYSGSAFDDYQVQADAGAELQLSPTASVSALAVGAQRWFGGRVASRQIGVKAGANVALGRTRRIGVQLDVRSTDAVFDDSYSGTQGGLYVTAEQSVAQGLVASLGGFVRRDWLNAAAVSNKEGGITGGFGGELPMGISFGIGGSVSRAVFDAPMGLFSLVPRKDWRYSARLTLGNRKIRVFGFSPQANLSYLRTDSNIPFFSTDRVRLRMSLARYF